MNKLFIPIITVLIIATGICAFFVFQKSAFSEPPVDRCGDGICDEFEKANPNLCPRDCQSSTEKPTQNKQSTPQIGKCGDGVCDAFERANPNVCPKDCQQVQPSATQSPAMQSPTTQLPATTPPVITPPPVSSGNSPFGIFGLKIGYEEAKSKNKETYFQIANDLGLNYVKIVVPQDTINPSNSEWRWKTSLGGIEFDFDEIAKFANQYGISIIPMFAPSANFSRQKDAESFAEFVYRFIARYKDKMNIKYTESQNEPNPGNDGSGASNSLPGSYNGTAENLVKLDNAAYEKIKAAFPDIMVGSPGFIGESKNQSKLYTEKFYQAYFKAKPKFDVFMYHDYPKSFGYVQGTKAGDLASEYNLYETYRALLKKYGYGDKPILISEGFMDTPYLKNGRRDWGYLDEDEASILWVEGYVMAFSNASKNNVTGKIITGISRTAKIGLIDSKTGAKRKQYYVVKNLIALFKKYPVHSRHLFGEINQSGYWLEEFKNTNGKKMWVAFNPFLYETADDVMPAITNKTLKSPQNVVVEVGGAKSVNFIMRNGVRTEKAVNGKINFVLNKEPVFIETVN
ncbi:MAG: cellulase family glycosylhydrolase [Nitrospirae bacterium]|nr:cellulase family glycosylhydrolase [Nitrospirota bacterium]